ncbi:MAG: hypothetical protein KBT15_04435, partial [Bacteroidales bacterium]|nr:hypothetical protein [Candidatus Minthousia equi]
INGQWYVFYHRPPRGFGNARQTMVAPVKIEWDKKPVAKGGQVRITGYDPYAPNEEWTALASNGDHYTGAEVTSEGFQIFGLDPFKYYSAGIACYINNNEAMQDQRDVWNNSMDLAGLKNGNIIGFKYFNFAGLAEDTKGCKAFEGFKTGDNAFINIFLRHGTNQAFKIHVMLDGPYTNSTWQGKEIATIDVTAAKPGDYTIETVRIPGVEGLAGKHAIYLVVEGPEVKEPERPRWGGPRGPQRPQGLLDLIGISFAKGTENDGPAYRPSPEQIPQVKIAVDGVNLTIPREPLLSTNLNGYTMNNHYQLYGRMNDNSVLTATCDNKDVQIEIGKIVDGRATVKATWKGVTKVFLIN